MEVSPTKDIGQKQKSACYPTKDYNQYSLGIPQYIYIFKNMCGGVLENTHVCERYLSHMG